jgi:hypothetical protein
VQGLTCSTRQCSTPLVIIKCRVTCWAFDILNLLSIYDHLLVLLFGFVLHTKCCCSDVVMILVYCYDNTIQRQLPMHRIPWHTISLSLDDGWSKNFPHTILSSSWVMDDFLEVKAMWCDVMLSECDDTVQYYFNDDEEVVQVITWQCYWFWRCSWIDCEWLDWTWESDNRILVLYSTIPSFRQVRYCALCCMISSENVYMMLCYSAVRYDTVLYAWDSMLMCWEWNANDWALLCYAVLCCTVLYCTVLYWSIHDMNEEWILNRSIE